MNLFKRSLAPVSDAAWHEIEEESTRTLKANLTARRVMDVSGPHGIELAAVNLGRLEVPTDQAAEGVQYGVRRIQPLIELRAVFGLDQWELDNADRGAADVDLDPLTTAAQQFARFEERAIYEGLPEAGIVSLREAAVHPAVRLGEEGAAYAGPISEALVAMRKDGIEGPYALVLGPNQFGLLAAAGRGCPALQHIEHLIGGPVLMSPILEGGFLLSMRGGDFEIVLGQDATLGWESHNGRKITLFLTESFTFRVLEPKAAVPLKP